MTTHFKTTVKRILNEELEKSVTGQEVYQRLPEVSEGKDLKKITPHPRDTKSKQEILDSIKLVVDEIDKNFTVIWDDHDDITVDAKDLFKVRIIPKWENNYSIEAYTRNEDRVFIVGQTLDQVKDFLKKNLKQSETKTEKAYNKSIGNYNLKDTKPAEKGLSQKNTLTPKTVGDTKNKEKDYTEKAVKNESDLPNQPLKDVKDLKKQSEHKVNTPEKPKKFKEDNKLTIKQK